MSHRFAGKSVIVTGAASGIGKATALAFARQGAAVSVVDIQLEAAETVCREIQQSGGEAIPIAADVSRPDNVERMVHEALEAFGSLDIAVNNAGIDGCEALTADVELSDWQSVMDVNLTGVFLCMKYEIPAMLKAGGAIVNTASVFGQVANPGWAPYAASKHGVIGLTKGSAIEYAEKGIRINAVCPGYIATPMILNQENIDELRGRHPIGRLGRPEEIAAAILWLASEEASFVTGLALGVDGGYLAQ